LTEHKLEAAVRLLQEGGVLAIPTDTLYGLAVDAFNADAIERVFTVKERPEGMALPVLLSGAEQLEKVAQQVPLRVSRIADAFWPGPLTLIVKRNGALPPRLTAGNSTVAVRVPDHPVPRALARRLDRPITGTSANISGAADPQTLEELRHQVGERVDLIVEDGPSPAGTASTIVDVSGEDPKLIREGVIPFDEIAALLNRH
jgi:L-threonylcarbamoyladenylate synthase